MERSRQYVIRHPKFDCDLDPLLDVFAPNVLSDLVKIGNEKFRSFQITTARQYVKAIHVYADFLRSLQESPVKTSLAGGLFSNSLNNWLAHAAHFSEYLSSNHLSSRVVAHSTGINFWFREMSAKRICPAGIALKIKKHNGKGVRTLLDFNLTPEAEASLSEFIAIDGSNKISDEAHLLYRNVCAELNGDGHDISLESLPMLAESTLNRRLDHLRNGLQDVFNNARKIRAEGLWRVRRGRLGHKALITSWLAWAGGSGYVNPSSVNVQMLSNDEFTDAFVAWCFDEHALKGIGPRYRLTDKYSVIRTEVNRRQIALGAGELQGWLSASDDLILSSYLMLVHDLSANPFSISELPVNSDYKVFNGMAGVDWVKRRAKKILTLLDGKKVDGLTPPSQVVATVRRATRLARLHCNPADKNNLFLRERDGYSSAKGRASDAPVTTPSKGWFNTASKELILRITKGKWQGTALSVRASVILLACLKHGIQEGQKVAQHSSPRTTMSYVSRLPMKLQNDAKIRAFMEWLEALVAIDIEGFAEKIGLDTAEFEKRRQEVLSSQFGGLHCRDNLSGFQEGSDVGKPCTQVSKCLTCEKRSNLFVATEDNVVHLLLWNDALSHASDHGIDISEKWLLWVAFIETMLGRLRGNSKHKAILAGAMQAKDAISTNPYLRVFRTVKVVEVE